MLQRPPHGSERLTSAGLGALSNGHGLRGENPVPEQRNFTNNFDSAPLSDPFGFSTVARALLFSLGHVSVALAAKVSYSNPPSEWWAYASMAFWHVSTFCLHKCALGRVRSSDSIPEKSLQIWCGVLIGVGPIIVGPVLASSPEPHSSYFGNYFAMGGLSLSLSWPWLHVKIASIHSNLRDATLKRQVDMASVSGIVIVSALLCISLAPLSCLRSTSASSTVYEQVRACKEAKDEGVLRGAKDEGRGLHDIGERLVCSTILTP